MLDLFYIAQVETPPSSDTIIGVIVTAFVTLGGSYILNVWSKKQQGQNEIDLKKLEVGSKDVEELKAALKKANDRIGELQAALAKERQTRQQVEMKLRDVKTAFQFVYTKFSEVVKDDPSGLAFLDKMKEFIND